MIDSSALKGPSRRALGLVSELLFVLVICSCAQRPFTWAADVPPERARPGVEARSIQQGDVVSVSVVGQPELSGIHTIGVDGTISLPNVGAVSVGNNSVSAAVAELTRRLSSILEAPKVSLVVVTRSIGVTIMGEVTEPGKFFLTSGDGVATALAMAGGITEFGDENAVFLIRSTEPLRIRFRMDDLLRGGDSARKFALRDGDLLVVE